jgi:hypothetical protein
MRPIDFCTPKPFKLEHPYPVASQRSGLVSCEAFRHPLEGRSRPGTSRLRARPRERLFSRAASLVRRRAEAGKGRLGAARCKRNWGEPRFTARFPLRRPVDRSRGRFLPPDADRFRSPLTPLSPPPCSQRGGRQANPTRWLGGRQDRFRASLVKGARIAGPGCLPSSVATRIPSGPKRGRNHVAFARARRSRDEDRRTEANRPPFAAGGTLRLRAWVPPVVRLPSTRSV